MSGGDASDRRRAGPCTLDAQIALAERLVREGRASEALRLLDRAVALRPAHAPARAARATLRVHLGRLPGARDDLVIACREQPADAAAWSNLGFVHEQLGDRGPALAAYTRALEADPACVSALLNRGALLGRQGRLAEALADAERLCAAEPAFAEAHFRRAEVLLAQHRQEEARAAAERCLAADPGHVKAMVALGVALAMAGELEAADALLERARAANPALAADVARTMVPFACTEPVLADTRLIALYEGHYRLGVGDWRDYRGHCERFAGLLASVAAHPAGPLDDAMLAFMAHALPLPGALVARHAAQVAHALHGRVRAPAHPFPPRADGRLRIGYLSANFNSHVNAHNTRPLFERAERERFEVLGYALRPPDGSATARAMIAGCERFRDLGALDDAAAAARIRDDGCDILVDLTGYTMNARATVLAYRPAPLRVGCQGYWSTLGPGIVDYHFTDREVSPPGDAGCWHEARVFLPAPAFIYGARAAPPVLPTRAGEGLPAGATVLACFSRPYKIDPQLFAAWMRVLARAPASVLWLFAPDPRARANLRTCAAAHGVAPERLVLAREEPIERHVARCALADLFLDTRWCNGHTTVYDALVLGVPVVAFRGDTPYARVAASLVTAAGLGHLVADTLDGYERLAGELATDARALDAARAIAGRGRALLTDEVRMTRAVERGYRLIWARHEAGLEPGDLELETAGAA